ncbi:MAG TPA: hypothetical protein DCP11_06310 [Microbacteriaceae bacterium]|jgi:hypothetical protein|nr:hypothetical protein [Microbacteriaceae bacterium]
MQNIDLPTRDDLVRLARIRAPGCVSIYSPAAPQSKESDKARIEVKSRLRAAVQRLEAAGTSADLVESITHAVDELLSDRHFWRRQSNSLAIFANGTSISSFRLANRLGGLTEVSDRFAIAPLLRAATFSHSAFVLALSQNSVRLIDVSATEPAVEFAVPDLPRDLESTVSLDLTNDRETLAHLRTSEDPKVRMREFSQAVDRALRPVLADSDRPLILAAAEPLASIFRSVSSSTRLVESTIPGNPEERSAGELAAAAAPILDEQHAAELAAQAARFDESASRGLADGTLDGVALAATSKAIDTLFVDIDRRMPGAVDEVTGAVTRTDGDDASHYDVIDEIVRRALSSDARVLAVRGPEVPGAGPVAAILRFAVQPLAT